MKFDVKNRFTEKIQFTADIECEESEYYSIKIELAIKWAIKNNVYLRGADLSFADLSGSNLIGADLSGSNLRGADLSGADLSDVDLSDVDLSDVDLIGADLSFANLRLANLSGSNLIGADLRLANLSGSNLSNVGLSFANLRGANLSDSNLRGADLSDVDLSFANLSGADLSGADLSDVDLRVFKHDFFGILLRFKNEIPEFVNYLKEGKIDGSCYSGECSCLMGTFSVIKNKNIEDKEFDIKDSNSPAERWFMMIKPGHSPENNFAAKKALEWIEEFQELIK